MNPTLSKVEGSRNVVGRAIAALLLAATIEAWASVTVNLNAPANGSSYEQPVNITLSASASASGGYTVSKVEFFNGTTLIGIDLSSPYSATWTNAPSGVHSITAKATAIKKNSPDQTATSSAASITINAPPIVTLQSPADLTVHLIPPPTITVSASASDSDGSIARVEFYDCTSTGALITTITTPPYTFQWTLPPPYFWEDGKFAHYGIRADAFDNLDSWGTSGCNFIEVVPAVELTGPANGASFTAPASITLNANPIPSDAPIDRIEFYSGAALIGQSSSAPYSFNWQNVPVGTYALTAKVISQAFEWMSSPVVNVNVTAAPTQATLYYIHADHLNTPRLVADATGTTVWRWDQAEPFGNNLADENPSGLGVFDLPLRLPGQYFDKETNLHYNYFRNYDPSIGRYEESDPIGLRGGLNTYAYVAGNPLVHVDPSGLAILICFRKLDSWIAGNHAYYWNDQARTCCGRIPGKDPLKGCREKGPPDDYCIKIEGSDGKENELMKCCDGRARKGPYIPEVNDCVDTVEDCAKRSGLTPPSLPGGSRTGTCPSCATQQDPSPPPSP